MRSRRGKLAIGTICLVLAIASAAPLYVPADPNPVSVAVTPFNASSSENFELVREIKIRKDGETVSRYTDTIRRDADSAKIRSIMTHKSEDSSRVRDVEYIHFDGARTTGYRRSMRSGEGEPAGNCTFDDGSGSYSSRVYDEPPTFWTVSGLIGLRSVDQVLAFKTRSDGNRTEFVPKEGVHRWKGEGGSVLVHVTDASGSLMLENSRLVASDVKANVTYWNTLGDALVVPGVSTRGSVSVVIETNMERGSVTVEEPAWTDEARACES